MGEFANLNKYEQLLQVYRENLLKALAHLEYSYNKINDRKISSSARDEESLEIWESFTSRFSRVIDLFLTKYLRTYVLLNDVGFEGSLRDFVNQAEKLHLIQDARLWMSYRAYRNIAAHEYNNADLTRFLQSILDATKSVIQIKNKL